MGKLVREISAIVITHDPRKARKRLNKLQTQNGTKHKPEKWETKRNYKHLPKRF